MRLRFAATTLLCLTFGPGPLWAGLHYSGETLAELPSQWRGFLLDQRQLRTLAVKPADPAATPPLRKRYEQEAGRLAKLAKERPLSADEAADLGALYVRLGDVARAVEVLRPAQQAHPSHYRLASNLGTAWQMRGDLDQAAAALRQAVLLAPGRYQKAEELQLRLVRQRARQGKDAQNLDDLFGVRYVGPEDRYTAGALAVGQRQKLPADAVARAQLLALWLPGDPRLLWQLAELANAHGDVAVAAAIMDGCVTEFGLRTPELRTHRQLVRAAADAARAAADKTTHDSSHAAVFKPRSSRPLLNRTEETLPPIDPKGVNPLPWSTVNDTTIERPFKPGFPRYLRELDGKQVELRGFMQPLGDDTDCAAFMLIEFPVGCWYCEMPEMSGIVLVELPADKTFSYTRGPLRVTGRLTLNRNDPENFLYTVKQAKVAEAEQKRK